MSAITVEGLKIMGLLDGTAWEKEYGYEEPEKSQTTHTTHAYLLDRLYYGHWQLVIDTCIKEKVVMQDLVEANERQLKVVPYGTFISLADYIIKEQRNAMVCKP